MKILFVVGNVSKTNDANTNITMILASELTRKGNEILILGMCDSSKNHQEWLENGISYMCFEEPESGKDVLSEKMPKLVLLLISSAITVFPKLYNYINGYVKQKNTIDKYKDKIQLICKNNAIDVVISVSAPIVTSISLSKTDIKCKKIMYQLDPYHSHYLKKKSRSRIKSLIEELGIYKSMDSVVVTDLIYADNQRSLLKYYNYKMKPLKLPNIRRVVELQCESRIKFDESKVNCVFVGNLYNDIRTPRYTLEVFQKIQNDDILIHFIGGGDTDLLHEFKLELNSNLFIHGIVDNNEAINAMLNADILINIGNTISNQLPSKIFDYISSGKPIINFIKSWKCPTLEYTCIYPLVLNLCERETITDCEMKTIEEFCINNKGRKIDYSSVEKIFNSCTIEQVADNFIQIIDKCR